MFWDKWIPEKLLINSTVCGIEIVINDEGYSLFYCLLKNKNNKLQVIKSGSCTDYTHLPEIIIKDKIPVSVVINGKGIITKKLVLNTETEINQPDFIQQNLPAFQSDDFFIQLFPQSNKNCLASIIRKTQLDKILAELDKRNYIPAEVTIGPSVLVAITRLLGNYNTLSSAINNFEISDFCILAINNTLDSKTTNKLNISGIEIEQNEVLPFAAGFLYITNQQNYITNNNLYYRKEHFEKQKTKFLFYSAVGFAFFICLINVFIFSSFFTKAKNLQSELDVYVDKNEKINQLLESYEKKKGLIEKTGLSDLNQISKYADKISSTIPKEVIITEFNFNPELKNNFENDSLLKFDKKTILVKGNCTKSLLINEWINVLKSLDFIINVNLETFLFNTEANQPNFELKIVTK